MKIPRKSNPGQFFIQSFKQWLQFISNFFMLLLIFSATFVSTAEILQCHYEQITSGILCKADGTLVKRPNIEIENTLGV